MQCYDKQPKFKKDMRRQNQSESKTYLKLGYTEIRELNLLKGDRGGRNKSWKKIHV